MEKTAPPNFDKEIIQAIKDIPPALNKLTTTLHEVPKQGRNGVSFLCAYKKRKLTPFVPHLFP